MVGSRRLFRGRSVRGRARSTPPRRRQVASRQAAGAHHRQPAAGLAPVAGRAAALPPAGCSHQELPRGSRQRGRPLDLRAARKRVLGSHHGDDRHDHRGRADLHGHRYPPGDPGGPGRRILEPAAPRPRWHAGDPPLRVPASHHLPVRRAPNPRRAGHAGLRAPPIVRLTNLGIRQLPADVVEAARAFGATETRILREVQLPLARPTASGLWPPSSAVCSPQSRCC